MLKQSSLYLIIFFCFCSFNVFGATREQMMLAKFEARLSQARTFKQALAIYADSNMKNPHQVAMHTDLRKIQNDVDRQSAQFEITEDEKVVPYINGGCQPRITCIPVDVQQATTGGIVFPKCVEVHRCSGCCTNAQFSCEATKVNHLFFSPITKFEISENAPEPISVLQPFQTENHTECQCRCKLTENACPSNTQTLDHELCRCREQMCFPQCQAMQRCQLLNNEEKPKCVCPRPIPGQNGSHSCPAGQQPDARCKKCGK